MPEFRRVPPARCPRCGAYLLADAAEHATGDTEMELCDACRRGAAREARVKAGREMLVTSRREDPGGGITRPRRPTLREPRDGAEP